MSREVCLYAAVPVARNSLTICARLDNIAPSAANAAARGRGYRSDHNIPAAVICAPRMELEPGARYAFVEDQR